MLSAAREAGVPIPVGEIRGRGGDPDFTFNAETGSLGIELSEVLRPASSNHGIVPVEQETFHKGILKAAQEGYCRAPGAKPVYVQVYFADARGKKQDKREMARMLSEFVGENAHRANPFAAFGEDEAPVGFASITINSLCADDWWSGECGGYTISSHIPEQLAERISSKNALLPGYRANLPPRAQVWLLLYSCVTVARGMSIPHCIDDWRFPFEFDRVFWFTALEDQFVEIRRAKLAAAVV